ncbi:MAG: SDR family oxidoreductase [Bryobacteraceae bacterium]|nr:SDR family oxidoreductase [Bryobacteraceae bacterium]MDW8377982.1 SDR family oxidoreductase [Bryobacterales bacterium]
MWNTLHNREVILAGGSGGLGAATAELLACEQARLTISYYSQADRAQRLASLGKVVRADLRSASDRLALLQEAPHLYGLVVFTGDPARPADPSAWEETLRRALEVNYLGPIQLAREAASRMQASGTEGSIVLFSTMQANALFAGSTAYAAAKAALQHAARILAKELRGKPNIRVNVVAPGVTAAGMAESSIRSGKYDHLLASGVIPRFGRAADVARAVRFFLEPDNYITGQVLCVDGGATL